MTTMAATLTAILNNAQTTETNTLTTFFENPAMVGLLQYLTGLAQQGQNSGLLHIDSTYNPLSQTAGYATLSGALAVINAPQTPGLVIKNGVGWIFLGNQSRFNDNISILTIAQFQAVVLAFINDLITEQDLTVTYQMGATMFDLQISWPT